jgi:hypothetical protein
MRRTFFGETERISANLEIFLSSRSHTFEILYCPASLIDPRREASTECAPAGKGAMKGFLTTEKFSYKKSEKRVASPSVRRT